MKKDKNKINRDKYIGIFGIMLFFISLIVMKLFTYYNIIIVSIFIDGFILFILAIVGLQFSKQYLKLLFGIK